MKSYLEGNEPLILMKKAIDIFAEGEKFHDNMSRYTHLLGLQGHKRWHKMQAKEDMCNRVELQHYIIDMFAENIEPTWKTDMPKPLNVEEYLNAYLEWEISVYKNIADIVVKLTSMGYVVEGKLVGSDLEGVRKEIEKIRRWIQDFTNAKWDYAYIRIKDNELHDKLK